MRGSHRAAKTASRSCSTPRGAWPHKNHARLFEAFALLRRERPELRLVLTGGGHSGTTPEGVEVRGHVSLDELVSLYRRAAALVFPSLYEGFGQPVLEAMACGCPVACSAIPSLAEVAGDAARTFTPDDPESIATAVRDVLADPGRYRERGLERAAQFTWTRAAAQYERSTASFSDRVGRRARRASPGEHRAHGFAAGRVPRRLQQMRADDDTAPHCAQTRRQRAVTLDDDDRVARVVVEVRRRCGAAGRGAALVAHHSIGNEDDGEAGRTHSQRELDVLDVGEQPVVEEPDSFECGTRDRHRRTIGASDVTQLVETGRDRRILRAGPSSRAGR